MPIFGLVWVASWVGCFFPSSQDLLQAPSHPSCVLPVQSLNYTSRSHGKAYSAVKSRSELAVSQAIQAQSTQSIQRLDGDEVVAFSFSSLLGISPSPQKATVQTAWRPTAQVSASCSPKQTSGNLLKVLGGLFRGTVISSRVAIPVTVTSSKANRSTIDQKGFGQCSLVPLDSDSLPTKRAERFQVKVKGQVVGEFFTKKQAVESARRLERLLSDSGLKASQIQPGLKDGMLAVKWGDRLIFALTKEQIQNASCNPELLTIQWVNNLRMALSEAPLSLPEAQEQMYGLQETSQMIEGMASWYGPNFNGRLTATGEAFDENDFTAAHPSLPFDTYLKVTNISNGKSVIVRVNDRGPYFDNRTLDLSREAARSLGSEETGVVPIEAVIMKPTPATQLPEETLAKL